MSILRYVCRYSSRSGGMYPRVITQTADVTCASCRVFLATANVRKISCFSFSFSQAYLSLARSRDKAWQYFQEGDEFEKTTFRPRIWLGACTRQTHFLLLTLETWVSEWWWARWWYGRACSFDFWLKSIAWIIPWCLSRRAAAIWARHDRLVRSSSSLLGHDLQY